MLGPERRRAASSVCSRVWACGVIQTRSVLVILGGVLPLRQVFVVRGGPWQKRRATELLSDAPPLTTRVPVVGGFRGGADPEVLEA